MCIGETKSGTTNSLNLTSVLSSRLVGLNSENLRTFSSCMDLPRPLSRHHFPKMQKEVLIAAEKEAKASMDRAKTQLEIKLGIDPITNCVHVAASIDVLHLAFLLLYPQPLAKSLHTKWDPAVVSNVLIFRRKTMTICYQM